MSAHRTSASSQSLRVAFSSPPTYWMGFCTDESTGSNRSHKESATGSVETVGAGMDNLVIDGQSPSSLRVLHPTLSVVSSRTKLVAADAFSEAVNRRVTVVPAYALRSTWCPTNARAWSRLEYVATVVVVVPETISTFSMSRAWVVPSSLPIRR